MLLLLATWVAAWAPEPMSTSSVAPQPRTVLAAEPAAEPAAGNPFRWKRKKSGTGPKSPKKPKSTRKGVKQRNSSSSFGPQAKPYQSTFSQGSSRGLYGGGQPTSVYQSPGAGSAYPSGGWSSALALAITRQRAPASPAGAAQVVQRPVGAKSHQYGPAPKLPGASNPRSIYGPAPKQPNNAPSHARRPAQNSQYQTIRLAPRSRNSLDLSGRLSRSGSGSSISTPSTVLRSSLASTSARTSSGGGSTSSSSSGQASTSSGSSLRRPRWNQYDRVGDRGTFDRMPAGVGRAGGIYSNFGLRIEKPNYENLSSPMSMSGRSSRTSSDMSLTLGRRTSINLGGTLRSSGSSSSGD